MNLRCWLSGHKYGKWAEVGSHLEKTCGRCGSVKAVYPSPSVLFAKFLIAVADELLEQAGRGLK